MGKRLQRDLKKIIDQFQQVERHRLLSGMAGSLGVAVKQQLDLTLPPPTGKVESPEQVKLQILLVEELSEDQQQRLRQILQRCSNPHGLLQLLQDTGFFDAGK